MSKPRQEFLGPITNLAAIFNGNNWVSDGVGIVDGYGAVIRDIAAVGLNARASGPGAQSAKGSFWVHSGSPTLPYFTDSAGNNIELGSGGGVPIGPENQVYWSDGVENAWSGNPIVNGLVATTYVSIGALGAGSLTFSALLNSAPVIRQDPINTARLAQTFIISAQANGSSAGMVGGDLELSGGAGWQQGSLSLSGYWVYVDSSKVRLSKSEDTIIGMGSVSAMAMQASNLSIQAESNSHPSGFGGDLVLMGGNGGSTDGAVKIQTPSGVGSGVDNVSFSIGKMGFASDLTTPLITQESADILGPANPLTIRAQNNIHGSPSWGGSLFLQAGTGNNNSGTVELKGVTVYIDSQTIGFKTGYGNQKIVTDGINVEWGTAPSLTLSAGANGHGAGTGGDTCITGGYGGYINGVVQIQTPTTTPGVGENNLTISKNIVGTTLQSAYPRLIGINNSGYGSATIMPRSYEQSASNIPRMDKQFGSFRLTGSSETHTLSFLTNIHGYDMPASTVLVGRFMIGWMGNGSVTNGGAMQFLYTITSDGSGNILRFFSSLSDNYATPGSGTTLTSGSAPSASTGESDYTLPATTSTPLLIVTIPTGPTTTYSVTFQATANGAPGNIANYFWESEYGWGNNS